MLNKMNHHMLPAVLAMVGLLLIGISSYSMKIANEALNIHAPLVDAAMEIKLQLTFGHLKFEELISGDQSITMDDVEEHIEQSKWYARAMLSGDENEEGHYIPLEDDHLRSTITATIEDLVHIGYQMKNRMADIDNAQPGSDLDQDFDQLFENAINQSDNVENALLVILQEIRERQEVLSYIVNFLILILIPCFIIYVVTTRRAEIRLFRELEMIAVTDKLTGLFNRRKFDDILEHEWSHRLRSEETLSLVMCDIDYFKRYNDHSGHQAGDTCLQSVAKVLKKIAQRKIDRVARYGGEEFAFILPFTNSDQAVKLMDKLHQDLAIEQVVHPDSDVSEHITLSVGIATITPSNSGYTVSEFIEVADQALYRAKQEGRNRTCFQLLA